MLWLTPDTPADTPVVLRSAGERHRLDSAAFRQVWASTAAIRLGSGHWLHLAPADPDAPGAPEIVLRTTSSGLLIGCATAAGEAAWQLSVHPEPAI
ncbi:hypothetical protein [Kitasatospora cheerisanensis]|uniref:Putative acetyltransferase n=1 Tax=Kitasatospora cheerisanensis KCTC 2395 TaxID=1348663 RepID=A0A066Z2M9_9ACTN|nr:hypothetical protein [Kitasatospora cheerisanensis]KDN84435.1 putative acetyltransferase [Kitasatospora cheerisanensis KCTC 2395]